MAFSISCSCSWCGYGWSKPDVVEKVTFPYVHTPVFANLRPDIVVWNNSTRSVAFLELTVCHESKFVDVYQRQYLDLEEDIQQSQFQGREGMGEGERSEREGREECDKEGRGEMEEGEMEREEEKKGRGRERHLLMHTKLCSSHSHTQHKYIDVVSYHHLPASHPYICFFLMYYVVI